jgi:hypothetical protein
MQVVMPKAATIARMRCAKVGVVVISKFPSWSPAAFPPDEREFAGTVPFLENGGFAPFFPLEVSGTGFFAAQIWDFSPQIGIHAFPIERRAVLP